PCGRGVPRPPRAFLRPAAAAACGRRRVGLGEVEFKNRSVFSWLPAGQGEDAVIHRPDLELSITYKGETFSGRGYSKRYFGKYGPHWGYRFIHLGGMGVSGIILGIQSSWLGGKKFLWTADATFRLGDGEAKYNYYKLLDGDTGELVQAPSEDPDLPAGQQGRGVHRRPAPRRHRHAPGGEWTHDFDRGRTNSRMQLRYCQIEVDQGPGAEVLKGYALNERCFGTL
ncbi:unnamed protein product, partial [Prorocentrum cordatum]